MAPPAPVGRDLESMVHRLVKAAWGPREATLGKELELDPRASVLAGASDRIVAGILDHARRVAYTLSVPMMAPRIVVQPMVQAAGQFIEENGWVKIAVGPEFFLDAQAAQAILCHETCHYILGANGIREDSAEANERLTDVAMFVLGLGELFLVGYRRAPSSSYRPGHRLGYLSDAEYRYVDALVTKLWATGQLQEREEEELERRLRAVIHDAGTRRRLLEAKRARHPELSQAALTRLVLEDVGRDRR